MSTHDVFKQKKEMKSKKGQGKKERNNKPKNVLNKMSEPNSSQRKDPFLASLGCQWGGTALGRQRSFDVRGHLWNKAAWCMGLFPSLNRKGQTDQTDDKKDKKDRNGFHVSTHKKKISNESKREKRPNFILSPQG